MLIRPKSDIRSSEITDEGVYLRRREFILASAVPALAAAAGFSRFATLDAAQDQIPNVRKSAYTVSEEWNTYGDITSYNNFYEFGTDKADPAGNAKNFRVNPWTVKIDGLVNKPADYQLEDLLKPHTLEERVYRLRCVEAWSMVIPWVGFPLGDLLRRVEPAPQAKFVEFTTLADRNQMPGLRSAILNWPYVEGLRLDEAMHPLTILAVGLYGRMLPNQDGAPIRLVVPWKYGFKSIKSIVRIRLVDRQPTTAWSAYAPQEYGFYSNVNPEVDHPRWSQGSERRIGEFFKRKTLIFNGYGDQVAGLYTGMDLRKNY
ncbi:MAG: protein-methionine-sulfoxide reductase catalytic subunit MsrP [Acidobacteria bacterium]|nr:protein-methionine-sulfoxide reductase catalytic subunit MsrP [Acidobacteriota bacterium]